MTQNTDWRPYVELSPDFSPEQRAQLECALDFIWQAQENEGQLLLRAAANNAGRQLLMAPSDEENFQLAGVIGVDFDQVQEFVVEDAEGEEQHLSLNGILVHEIFHAAQPRNSMQSLLAELDAGMQASGIPESEQKLMRTELQGLLTSAVNTILVDKLATGFTSRSLSTESPDLTTLETRGSQFLTIMQQMIERLEDPNQAIEQQATRYTDAFMAKNARAEPRRGNYENGDVGESLDEPIVFSPNQELNASPGFSEPVTTRPFPSAQQLPTVRMVGMEGIIREAIREQETPTRILPLDFDLRALGGCMLDSDGECQETGQLTPTGPNQLSTDPNRVSGR